MDITILGIESSCDDTSAAVIRGGRLLSNVIASQEVHRQYGGVIPELASRAHQQNIIPVVDRAIREAGIGMSDLDGIAFTRGPGLLGSLLVGVSFAKGLALSLDVPMMEINHLQGHICSHFIDLPDRDLPHPRFPFLCLLVSGGHSQIVLVKDYLDMEIVGTTIDDAAGEAFDKCAKLMGLPYPGGPVIDRLAKEGDPKRFKFAKPSVDGFNYSFSGLKTSFLYFLRDRMHEDPRFIDDNKANLCASLQATIIDILLAKLTKAAKQYDIRDIAIAGGVSARSDRGRGPQAGLADVPARVPVHDRQCGNDRRNRLFQVSARRIRSDGHLARRPHQPDVTSFAFPMTGPEPKPEFILPPNESRTRAGRGRCFRLSISCAAYSVNAENLPAKSGRTLDHTVQFLRQNTASGISRSDSAQEILPNLGNEASPLSPSPSTEYGIGHKPQRFRTGNSPESWQRNETGFRLPIQASEKGTVSATQAAAGLAQEIRRSLAGPLRMKAGQSFRRNRKKFRRLSDKSRRNNRNGKISLRACVYLRFTSTCS